MLDIFNDDAFSLRSLTEAINVLPYVPKRIGSMGLFKEVKQRTTTAYIERKGNIVSLLPTKPRGSGQTTKRKAGRRDLIPIAIPYIPHDDDILAEDVSGIREFNTEEQMEVASAMMNDHLSEMRANHEVTHEYMRLGAVKGVILDSDEDQTELVDLFDAFDLTQHEVYFDLEGDGTGIKAVCMDIIQWVEDVLGGTTYSYVHAFVGNTFFQQLVANEEVKESYMWQADQRWKIDQQGSGTQGRGSNQVTFGDITFENYRGKVGSVDFIEADEAHFFPMGVDGLFQTHVAPAQTMSDVNKPGQVIYAQQKPKDWDAGIDIHTESNVLMICKRPKLLVKGYAAASS